MSGIRIAILIFLIGASAANFFAAKTEHDRIGYMVPAQSAAPGTIEWFIEQRRANDEAYRASNERHQVINDSAWMREAIIVTIAGAAWFAMSKRGIS
jgi:hypothetical protein